MPKMDKADFHFKMDNGLKIFFLNWKYLHMAIFKNNFYVLQAVKELSSNYKDEIESKTVTKPCWDKDSTSKP